VPERAERTESIQSALTSATVLTQHNDNARTGANLAETTLTPSNVPAQFGYLFDLPVTGLIYAQPLVASNVPVNGGAPVASVLYAATMHNTVYAFDASAATAQAPLLSMQLETPTAAQDPVIGNCGGPVTVECCGCTTNLNIHGEIGILSTPVIVNQTMYLISNTGAGTSNKHYLHALDITTLKDLPNSPQLVTLPGNATFPSFMQIQRSSLLAANGMIYASFASYCDAIPYHGWVIGFDANTLKATSAWSSTPNGQMGGIWQAGQGPAADASGNVYVQTGNGDTDIPSGGQNASEAMVKLNPQLGLVDWFVPYNYSTLNNNDWDFASGGVLLMPGTSLVLGGGKFSTIYLTRQSSLGRFSSDPSGPNIVQSLVVAPGGYEIHGSPVYWNGPTGPHIYVWASNDSLKSFHFNGTTFDTNPQQAGVASIDNPGAMLSVSASGSTNGIVWATRALSGSAEFCYQQGRLLAFDASDVTQLLWDSANDATSPPFQFSKNSAATIANGRVYLATFSNMVRVYGLGGSGGHGFGAPTPWSNGAFYGTIASSTIANPTQLADVNGDGKADAVAFDGSSTWVMLSTGSGFGPPTSWSSTNFWGSHDAFSTQLADVNGDNKADAVAFDGTSTWVMLSTGSGFGPPTAWSSSAFYGTIGASTIANPTQLADVNGDGMADAVAFDGSSTWVMLSTGSGFGPPTSWSSTNFWGSHDTFSTQLADVNGDNKADAVAFDGTSTWVMLSTGSSFGAPTAWSNVAFYGTIGASTIANPTQLADVNGDGKADAVAFDGTTTWVMLSNGSGFGAPMQWSSINFYGTHDVYSTWLGDVNGDGRADAVAFDGTSSWVMLSNSPVGITFGSPTQWSNGAFYGTISSSTLADPTQLADVNGDRKADAVAFDGSSVWVMLSTGSGFGPPTAWSNSNFWGTHDVYSTWLGDVNGDNKADAVAFDGSSAWVMLSTGSGFGAPTQWSSSAFYGTISSSTIANPTQLADVNGDRKADAVAFDGSSVWVMLSTGSGFGPPTAWSNTNFWGTHDAFSTWLADVNGDNKADAIAFDGTSTWVMLSTGSGFGAPTQWSNSAFYGTIGASTIANPTQLADVNGDRKPDAVAFDGASTWVMTSTGAGFGPPAAWSNANFWGTHDVYSTWLGDVNGDRKADAVAFDGTSSWVMLGQ
jgi:hypothetical protein